MAPTNLPQLVRRGRSVSLTIPVRPVSLNAERSAHWTKRHETTAHVLQLSTLIARGLDRYTEPVHIDIYPVQKGRLPDAGNCYPTAKAAIDGLVKARVLDDDDPTHVHSIRFHAPRRPRTGETEHLRLDITPT